MGPWLRSRIMFEALPESEKQRIRDKIAKREEAARQSPTYRRWYDALKAHLRKKFDAERREAEFEAALAKWNQPDERAEVQEEQALEKMDAPARAAYRRQKLEKRAEVNAVAKEILGLFTTLEDVMARIANIEERDAQHEADSQLVGKMAKSYRVVDKGDEGQQ